MDETTQHEPSSGEAVTRIRHPDGPEPGAKPDADHSATSVVVLAPKEADRPIAAPATPVTESTPARRARVQVVPHLIELVTGLVVTPEEKKTARAQRDLNEVVHRMLIIGLAISTVLMLIGIGLDIALQRDIPTAVPDFRDVFARVAALRPSGFLALGLLVLIATPVLRVIGSIFAFIYERDWRYAGITFLVLVIILVSLVLGRA